MTNSGPQAAAVTLVRRRWARLLSRPSMGKSTPSIELIDAVSCFRAIMSVFFQRAIMVKAKSRRKILAWSKDDVKNLRAFAKSRLSGTQAAKKLRRSPGAVAQKAMKLKVRGGSAC